MSKGYFISISNGMLEPKHREAMGSSVWEYMWLLDKVTKIDDEGNGIVLGGKPLILGELAGLLGVTEKTVSRSLHRLEDNKYVSLTRTPHGLCIKVCRAKKWFGSDQTKMSDHKKEIGQKCPADRTKMSDVIRQYSDNTDNTKVLGALKPKAYGNPEVNDLMEYLKGKLGVERLDGSERDNRRYAYMCMTKFAKGVEGFKATKMIIDLAQRDDFHRSNLTSFRYLYYNGIKIVNSAKSRVNQNKRLII